MSDQAPTQRAKALAEEIGNKAYQGCDCHNGCSFFEHAIAETLIQSAIEAAVREALEQAADKMCGQCVISSNARYCVHRGSCANRAAILGEDKKGAHNED